LENQLNHKNRVQSVVQTMYEQMIEEEKSKGTLFETETKPKKKKKLK